MAAGPFASVFVIVIVLVAAFSTWTDCAIARSRNRLRRERSEDNQNVVQSCVEGLFNRTNCTGSNQLSSLISRSGESDDDDEDGEQINLMLFVETTASSGDYNLYTNESLMNVCSDDGEVCQDLFCRFNLAEYLSNPAGRRLKLEVHSEGRRQLVCEANLSNNDSRTITESEFTVITLITDDYECIDNK